MTHAYRSLVGAVLVVALLGGHAKATDQGITGKKLLLKQNKVVLLSKDPGIGVAGSDPVGGADSSVGFDGGGGLVTFSLPKTLWSADGSSALFKYKNDSAPAGPSAVKITKVKPGLLKVVAKGLPFAVPNGAATVNAVLSLDGGTNRYCMSFSGTGDGDKFLVKDAGPGTCPGGAACGNNSKEVSEQCDGTDAAACPGQCRVDCTCPPGGEVCGNNLKEGSEQCDGTDATACPTDCLPDCTCGAASCPWVTYGSPLICQTMVTDGLNGGGACLACCGADVTCYDACLPAIIPSGPPFNTSCGIQTDNESCNSAVFAAGCAEECCGAAVCGNNARAGAEQCDGTDDAACPGRCRADCTCGGVCPDQVCFAVGVTAACNACVSANSACLNVCVEASAPLPTGFGCTWPLANEACSSCTNAIGCGDECCP